MRSGLKFGLLFALLAVTGISCTEPNLASDVGCIYAFPLDGGTTQVLGCSTADWFNTEFILDQQYKEAKWIPISDCDLCGRRAPRDINSAGD